ncbi:copper transporter [Nocardioides speluncae]|uniref:copper transporter n=1 Tax=Nocardioides speluncae TaxID=2670337 RepID=UPI00137A7FC8|nr:copper transporter [Nocardioides speluncae]
MISFRHHIVTLVAVFLALAAGIVLGGGPLSEVGRGSEQDLKDAEARNTALEARLATGDKSSTFQDAFAGTVGGQALSGGLDDRSVVLVTLPGVDNKVVRGLTAQVKQAGGTVAGHYGFQPAMVDPSEKSLVDTLGSQLRTQHPDAEIPADAPTYDRMGRLVGRAIGTGFTTDQELDETASSIVESLKGAELMTTQVEPTVRSPLVIVVLGDGQPADGADALVSGLLAGMAEPINAMVVAASTVSADGGLLAGVRADGKVDAAASTADSVQTGAGRVATVLALIDAAEGKLGSYGASGADGAAPLR